MKQGGLKTLLILLMLGTSLFSQDVSEYIAKIVLMDKVTAYVEWPFEDHQPFVIGVVGRNPFGDELENYFRGRKLKNRPVQIRYFKASDDLSACDLLFICASEKDHLSVFLSRIKGHPVLTMSDQVGFAQAGVMLNMVFDEKRLVFEVNAAQAKDAKLLMATGFLRISKVVQW